MSISYNLDSHRVAVRIVKGLAMDAVEAAQSGHPGMPMGAADMTVALWAHALKHDPTAPAWPDRDRFILSAGHGSMLLYSLLHLSGYDVSVDDIKAFRQWGSKTPGHPEVGHTPGVETTTGPLGQGFATGVGMAIAERFLRETFGADLCDHWTYGVVSDGDLMEGISSEAASFAGHLQLGRIVYLYDDNHISIDGSTDLAFTEDRAARFAAFGWHVQTVDGHDPLAVIAAIDAARADHRPSLICCRTTIGQGSAKEGSEKTHGAPLGKDDVAGTKARIGLDPAVTFATDPAAYAHLAARGASAREAWEARVAAHPRGEELLRWLRGDAQALVDAVAWPAFPTAGALASRKASEACLKAIVAAHPNVIGGSADLAGSNGTAIGKPLFTPARFEGAGTFAFGVREHAMAAACNGMALHGGVVPYCATFLMFHDYMRPSVRLSCLMKQRVVYIYSHDSFYLGEDGPTHQPIETLFALRTIPGMQVIRPCDAAETGEAWKAALLHTQGPTALILTRQNLPHLDHTALGAATQLHRGAYVLVEPAGGAPQLVLIATGSEVSLAMAAAVQLEAEGVRVRVVSAPWLEAFERQDADYRRAVLPPGVPRIAIEAGVSLGWKHIVGETGAVIGVDHFGASAPDKVLAEQFGFTPDNVVRVARGVLAAQAG